MSLRLLKKVSIITGSTDGIGLAIADRFLKEGSKVMICSRKSKNVNYAVDVLGKKYDKDMVKGVVCNVGNSDDRKLLISETVSNFGQIDILVSNAATNIHVGNVLGCNEKLWDKMFETNVKSTFFLIKEAEPHLTKNSSIIINSSISGLNPIAMLGIYSITKTALLGMIKVLSQELASGDKCIRVNGIAPGIIKTKFSSSLHQNDSVCDKLMSDLHLKRFGEGEDCAGVATFLASDDSSYVTGETIVVAGGMVSRL